MKNWYEKTAQQTLAELSVSAQGLTVEEAARRLEQHGENKLTEGRKKSALQVFAEQFKDLLVAILIVAAVFGRLRHFPNDRRQRLRQRSGYADRCAARPCLGCFSGVLLPEKILFLCQKCR